MVTVALCGASVLALNVTEKVQPFCGAGVGPSRRSGLVTRESTGTPNKSFSRSLPQHARTWDASDGRRCRDPSVAAAGLARFTPARGRARCARGFGSTIVRKRRRSLRRRVFGCRMDLSPSRLQARPSAASRSPPAPRVCQRSSMSASGSRTARPLRRSLFGDEQARRYRRPSRGDRRSALGRATGADEPLARA